MDEQRFNMSMRKYLKEVGVTSQQAIEKVVRDEGLEGKGKTPFAQEDDEHNG